jgi:hypothetical protein
MDAPELKLNIHRVLRKSRWHHDFVELLKGQTCITLHVVNFHFIVTLI